MAAVQVLKVQDLLLAIILIVKSWLLVNVEGSTSWCVARSDANTQALQTALDYACASGADCNPIQSNGLCFLPNTIEAHASYAFNSFYQRKAMAPGSCDFVATATVAKTDPSYGSCMYPSSQSTAGGIATPTTVTNNPSVATTTTTTSSNGEGGTTSPGLTPPLPITNDSKASLDCIVARSSTSFMLLLVLSFIFHPIWMV